MHKKFAEIGPAVLEICSRTERQTDKQTDRNTPLPYWGGVMIFDSFNNGAEAAAKEPSDNGHSVVPSKVHVVPTLSYYRRTGLISGVYGICSVLQ